MHGYFTWNSVVVVVVKVLTVPCDRRCLEVWGGNEAWPTGLYIEIVFFIFPEAFAQLLAAVGISSQDSVLISRS